MTARRASAIRPPAGEEPATQASWALAVVATLENAGIDREQIAALSGVDLAAMASPSARLPLSSYARLWRLAVAHLGETAGLEVGANLRVSHWQMLGLGLATSRSAREYLDRLITYLPLMTNGVEARLRDEEAGVTLTLAYTTPEPLTGLRLECVITAELRLVQSLFGIDLRPLVGIDLLRERPDDPRPWQAALGPNIRWGAPITAIRLPAALLDVQFPAVDPEMSAAHLAAMQRALAALDRPKPVQEVRHLLLQLLPEGEPSLHDVARRMALSGRSLQRRLGDSGTGYREVLDELRQELALDYLRRGLPIGEVTSLLGFSEPTSFHAAFKRWTGTTPGQFRTQSAPADPGLSPP